MVTLTASATVTDRGGHAATATATSRTWVRGGLPAGWTPSSTVTQATFNPVAGTTYTDVDFLGRISCTVPDATFIRCRVRGSDTPNALVSATSQGCVRLRFEDSEIIPQFKRNDTNCFDGHDTTFLRCDIARGIDGLHIQNGTLYSTAGPGWETGMVLQDTTIRALARWTAAIAGVVHPQDKVTHNDAIQQFGGNGTIIDGCTIEALWELQYGHLFLQSSTGTIYTAAQAAALPDAGPFIGVPIGSLADGGPFVAPFGSNGTGLRSLGEMNMPQLAGLMINATQGPSTGFKFTNNLCRGGEFFTNGGANPYQSGLDLGIFTDSVFDRAQGNQGSGTGNGHTIDLGGTWGGHVLVARNVYLDNGAPVTVRT